MISLSMRSCIDNRGRWRFPLFLKYGVVYMDVQQKVKTFKHFVGEIGRHKSLFDTIHIIER